MTSISIPWKKTAIFGGVSILALFVIFKTTVNIKSFSTIISQIDMRYFWLAFATMPISYVLDATRWYSVLRASGFHVPFKKTALIITSSIPLFVVPGRLGDLARSYPIRHEVPVHQTIGTVVLEKIIDVCVLLGFAGIGLCILRFYVGSFLSLAIAILAIPGLIIFKKISTRQLSHIKILEKVHSATKILDRIGQNKIFFGTAILSSILNMGLSILQFYWLMFAIHAPTPFVQIFAFLPFCIFVGLIPLTLAGTGTRDVAIIHFFSRYAMPAQALSAGILYGLQAYWIPALLALPLLPLFFRNQKKV